MPSVWTRAIFISLVSPGGPGGLWVLFPFLVTRLSEFYYVHFGFFGRFAGSVMMGFGFLLYYLLLSSFANRGKGTPAPYDPPKRLITDGILGITRNPNYLANYIVVMGEALFFSSTNILLYWFFLVIALSAYLIYHEEPQLRNQYGQEFLQYESSVPRWFPSLKSVANYLKQ